MTSQALTDDLTGDEFAPAGLPHNELGAAYAVLIEAFVRASAQVNKVNNAESASEV